MDGKYKYMLKRECPHYFLSFSCMNYKCMLKYKATGYKK